MTNTRWAVLALAVLSACGERAPQVRVGVQALTLPAIEDAIYDLAVINDAGEVVWTERVSSKGYGDGRGSLTYVGPCDASDSDGDGKALNLVQLWLVDLPPLAPTEWENPTANGPLVQTVECVSNQDQSVEFTIAVMRDANQGFFDIMVNVEDLFCSAKYDCVDAFGAPNELLHNPQTGQRELTGVLAFACTAGPGSDTRLHMDDLRIVCANGAQMVLDPSLEGISPATPPLVFGSLVMRGGEFLVGGNKSYWNVAMGLDTRATGSNGVGACRLQARATASDGGLVDGVTPPGVRYPYVAWDVPLTDASGLTCSRHPLGGGNGVSVVYGEDVSFAHEYLRPQSP